MPIFIEAGELTRLRRELREDVDIADDERLRALEKVELARVVSGLGGIVAAGLAFGVTVFLMQISLAAGIASLVLIPASAHGFFQLGRRVERAHLRAVLRAAREQPLEAIGASNAPVAFSTFERSR